MKVLLFTIEYPPFKGGVANYYKNVVKNWPEPDNILVLHNNNNLLLKNWLWPKWLPALWQLWQIIKKEKIEHVLIGHILPLGTVTYFVTKLAKIPYSVFLHGMDFTYALRMKRKKEITKKILVRANRVICANSYTAKLVEEFIGDKLVNKIVVANPGVEPRQLDSQTTKQLEEKFKDKYNLQNKIILFSIGRLVKRKGFDKVIEAMPEVLKRVPDLVYVIAGDGPDKSYLRDLVSNLETKSLQSVIFLGKISDKEKWIWLNLSNIFIMPARSIEEDFEGFGIVYLEANFCSKPVIAGNSGGVPDAVKDTETGILVDPENTERIAGAIIKLAQDENLRKKLGEQGKKRAILEFSWDKQVKKIYNIINK